MSAQSRPTHPCLSECAHLIALANAMTEVFNATSTQDAPDFLHDWRTQAEAMRNNPTLDSLGGERALEKLSLDLRRLWLQHVYAHSGGYMMSPPHTQRKYLPDGARIGFPYDRWLKPQVLEQRLNALHPAPKGWNGRAYLFANAMAAIVTSLQVYRAFAKKTWPQLAAPPQKPLSLHWFGGYFEIIKALHLVCDDHLHGRKHTKQQDLCTAIERGIADLVLIEPVAANIELEVFDLDAFTRAWNRRPANARPCTIIVDASLNAGTFPIERLCLELAPNPPAMVILIRSGLKLDQEGLELSNAGLLNLWMPSDADSTNDPKNAKRFDQFTDTLEVSRTTIGAGLSQNEYAALSAPFFLDREALAHHADAVFANNRELAEALAYVAKPDGTLFQQVLHPCLGQRKDLPWAEAPYVNLRYRPDDKTARAFLHAVLQFEARARTLTFQSGSSFGFRGHRFEMGFARGFKHNTLRVAMGARGGPSKDGVIQLFRDLAAYPDFAALRAAYPQIAAKLSDDPIQEEA